MGRLGLTPPSSGTYFNMETLWNDLTRIALASTTKRALAVAILDSSGDQISTFGSAAPTSISDGSKTVTTAGTPVELVASTTSCKFLDITALSTNTGIIAVGGSTVDAQSTPVRGAFLNSEDTIRIQIDDVNKVFIDSSVNGEGVSFTFVN